MDVFTLIDNFWNLAATTTGDKAAVISVVIGGIVTIVGLFLKFKKVGIDKATAFSDIDEKRFNQLSEQLRQSDHDRRTSDQESDLLTIERDHYRSRVRDLIFMLKQLRWTFDHCGEKCPDDAKQMEWPLENDIEFIEQWAMISSIEAGYVSGIEEQRRLSERRDDGREEGRRKTDG